jgi:amino acid efflux transporter
MTAHLQKHVGAKELLAYYISSVMGVGILIIPGIAAQIAGPASLLAWIFLAILSAPFAIIFAKMSMLVPSSGGVPAFIEQTFDPALGKTAAILLTLTMVVGNPVLGLGSAHYLRALLGFNESAVVWVGYGFMLLSVLFNLIGLRLGSKIQFFMLLILITGLVSIIILATPAAHLNNMTPFFSQGYASVGSAIVVCFFSFIGWENVSSIAEEVQHPKRTFRQVIPWAVFCVGGLYILIALIYLAVVPNTEAINDPTVITSILRIIFGSKAANGGSIVAIVLLILATNSWILGASRLVFSLARNNLLPSLFSKVSRTTGVPTYALLLLAVGYGLVTLLVQNKYLTEQDLIKFANVNFMLVYLIAFIISLNIFTSKLLKTCAWVGIVATTGSILFLGWMILIPIIMIAIIYSWVSLEKVNA